MVDDVGRRMLFGTLESSLGREAAIKMMELMPEVEWTDLALAAMSKVWALPYGLTWPT
ncbi:hypothetical protein BH23ACT1_BH23ACT1_14320 [soil metagenome]